MADEAFALSPISARAELPSEADYDAIREALHGGTARGRWFLGRRHGKRNRNADTTMVLDAVARIEATIVAAQKPAPSNELPDALVLIRGLLSDARASAAQTMSGPDAELALAAVNKAVRIIREIAWTLREYGTDARICDMLDAQVNAIEASHQQTIAPETRDAVLATFDLLIRRIGELGGSADARPSWSDVGKPLASPPTDLRDPSNARDDRPPEQRRNTVIRHQLSRRRPKRLPRSRQSPTKSTSDAQDTAAQDATAQDTTTSEDTTLEDSTALDGAAQASPRCKNQRPLTQRNQDTTGQDTTAHDTTATKAHGTKTHVDRDTQDQDALADETLAQETSAQETSAQDTTAYEAPEVTPPFSEGSDAAMTMASAKVAPAGLPEPEVVAASDAETEALDFETAQDLAVLDVIALEMAEPEIVREELSRFRAAAPVLSLPFPSLPRPPFLSLQLPSPTFPNPTLPRRNWPTHGWAKQHWPNRREIFGPDRGERGMVESAYLPNQSLSNLDGAALATAIFTTQKPEQPSLGAALIASGIVSGSGSAHDALAPLRRMSQAERIAFFS